MSRARHNSTPPTLGNGQWTDLQVDDKGNLKITPVDSAGAAVPVSTGEYETVAAGQTDQSLGATGGAGDYLEGLICVVATAATSQVQIKDGAGSAITVLPNNIGGGIGTYSVPIGLKSVSGAWKITTAAGVSVIAVGNFT